MLFLWWSSELHQHLLTSSLAFLNIILPPPKHTFLAFWSSKVKVNVTFSNYHHLLSTVFPRQSLLFILLILFFSQPKTDIKSVFLIGTSRIVRDHVCVSPWLFFADINISPPPPRVRKHAGINARRKASMSPCWVKRWSGYCPSAAHSFGAHVESRVSNNNPLCQHLNWAIWPICCARWITAAWTLRVTRNDNTWHYNQFMTGLFPEDFF